MVELHESYHNPWQKLLVVIMIKRLIYLWDGFEAQAQHLRLYAGYCHHYRDDCPHE